MAVRPILQYPDRRLRVRSRPVERVDDAIRRLLDDLAETMYAAPGVGLAANQVGVPLRVCAIDVQSPQAGELVELINPRLIAAGEIVMWKEGCLSLPGLTEEIERAAAVSVEALDRRGNPFRLDADGLLAIAVQHELDHLDGKLILDRMSYVRRRLAQRRLARERAAAGEAAEPQ
ncbi:MAG: peptide deformylase [Myxococcota bacterium]|nr:peptide deformylase [Myxococcota bacterium]